MKLPEIQQVAFQGAAQGQAFAPVQVPDPNPGLQAKLAVIASSFQNIETSGVQEYKRQEVGAKQMQQLYEFVPNFAQGVTAQAVDVQDTLAKKTVAANLWRLKDEDLKKDFNTRRQEELVQETVTDTQAAPHIKDLQNNKQAETAGWMQWATGRTAVYRDIEKAKLFATVAPEWAAEQRKTNTGTMTFEGLGTFKINDPNVPETVSDMIVNRLIDEAMGVDEVSGKTSIPMDILGKYAFPLLRQNTNVVKQRFHKEIRSRRGESQRRDLLRKFNIVANDPKVDPKVLGQTFFNTIDKGSATTPRSGENMGIGAAAMRKQLQDSLVEAVEAGMPFDIDRLGDAVMPNGKLLREEYPDFYNELSNELDQAVANGFRNRRAAGQASVMQKIQTFNMDVANNPGKYSTDDVSRFMQEIIPEGLKHGLTVQEMKVGNIQSLALQFTQGAEKNNQQIASAIEAYTSGELTIEHPLYQTEAGRSHWTYQFAKQMTAQKDTPTHKAIEQVASGIIGTELSSAKTLNGDILGVGKQMLGWWMRSKADLIAFDLKNAKTEEDIAGIQTKYSNMAQEELSKAFKPNSGHLFELDDKKRPFRWEARPEAQRTATDRLYTRLAHLSDVARNGGDVYRELHNNPSSFASNTDILAVLPKLLAGQPLPTEYALAVDHINESAGKNVLKNGMHLYGTLLRSVDPDLYKSSNFEQIAAQYQQLPSAGQRDVDRILSGQYFPAPSKFLTSSTPVRDGMPIPVRAVTGSIPHPLNNQPGYTLPNITPLAGTTKAQLVNLPNDAFRWLAYGASGEAGPGDDIYGVAASILNRYAEGRGSIQGIVTAYNPRTGLYQYEAVGKGLAKFRPDIEAKFRSPEGQAKLIEALIRLQGRTDFKGRSLYKNAGRTDVLFDARGNFYHHPEERAKGDVYSGPPKNAWRKFVSGL